MGNCTGVIYGKVTDSDRTPLAGVEIKLNWVQKADGGALKVGGDDKLQTFVPCCPTTKAGEYIIPFFGNRLRRLAAQRRLLPCAGLAITTILR